MKKFLGIVLAAAALSACACFDSNDEPVRTYRTVTQAPADCDYFDGRTCYRYTYRKVQQVAPVQEFRYRESNRCRNCCPPVRIVSAQNNCGCASCGCPQNNCAPTVTETKEPVEVVYKKTTTRTVYEPKTSSEVSYERVSCEGASCGNNQVMFRNGNAVVVEEVK